MSDQQPEDPFGLVSERPTLEGAIIMHELFTTYVAAGFEPYVAMWLVGALMKGLPMPEWLAERLAPEEGS